MRRQLQKLIQLLFSPFDDINIRKIKDRQMQRYRKTLTVMKVRASYVSIPLAALESDEDKKLFTEIYEQYRPQMERTAMHFLKSHADDVEDAVQNAFMQMIRHFEKIFTKFPCEELSFWIISIVKNEALMIIRKSQKTVPLEDWDGLVRGIGKYVRLY